MIDYLEKFKLSQLKKRISKAIPINNKLIKKTFDNFDLRNATEHDFYIKNELMKKNIEEMIKYNNKNDTKYGIFQQKCNNCYSKQNKKKVFFKKNQIIYSTMLRNKILKKHKKLKNKHIKIIKKNILGKY